MTLFKGNVTRINSHRLPAWSGNQPLPELRSRPALAAVSTPSSGRGPWTAAAQRGADLGALGGWDGALVRPLSTGTELRAGRAGTTQYAEKKQVSLPFPRTCLQTPPPPNRVPLEGGTGTDTVEWQVPKQAGAGSCTIAPDPSTPAWSEGSRIGQGQVG